MALDVPQNRVDEFIGLMHEYTETFRRLRDRSIEYVSTFPSEDEFIEILSRGREEREEYLKPLAELFGEIAEGLYKTGFKVIEYNDVLCHTPWVNDCHFTHNMGSTVMQSFFGQAEYAEYSGGESRLRELYFKLQNLHHLFDQMIAHLNSVVFSLDPREHERAEKGCFVIDALQTVVKARIFYNELNFAGEDFKFEDAPTVSGVLDSGLQSGINLSEIIEMIYVPFANALRIMAAQENAGDLRLEIGAMEIEYEGRKILVMEFFNTGPFVDLTELQQKLVKLDESVLKAAGGSLAKVVAAVKAGSKQAHLSENESVLVLDGLTMVQGGTGIGLADMRRQIELTGGALLLNNVYIPGKEGFCVTVFLPQGEGKNGGDDFTRLKTSLRNLKDVLQSGECFLSDLSVEKAAC